jgi:hypothetical protein
MMIIIEKLQLPRCCDEVVQWIQKWLSHEHGLEKRRDSIIMVGHQKSSAISWEGPGWIRFGITRSDRFRGIHHCLTTIGRSTASIALGTTWRGFEE